MLCLNTAAVVRELSLVCDVHQTLRSALPCVNFGLWQNLVNDHPGHENHRENCMLPRSPHAKNNLIVLCTVDPSYIDCLGT